MIVQAFEIKVALLGYVRVGKTTVLNALFQDKFSEVSMRRMTAGINLTHCAPSTTMNPDEAKHEEVDHQESVVTPALTPEELKTWTMYYDPENLKEMENYVMERLEDPSDLANMRPFARALALMARAKDNVAAFKDLYGFCYRWVCKSEVILDSDELSFKAAPPFGFKKRLGGRFVLQLRRFEPHEGMVDTNDAEWQAWTNWFEVRWSQFADAGFGLYACRPFPANSLIGWYCGNIIYDSHNPGGPRCSAKDLEAAGIKENPYQLQYRNGKGSWVMCQPKPFKEMEGSPGFMGLHLMNNFLHTFSADQDDPSWELAKKN